MPPRVFSSKVMPLRGQSGLSAADKLIIGDAQARLRPLRSQKSRQALANMSAPFTFGRMQWPQASMNLKDRRSFNSGLLVHRDLQAAPPMSIGSTLFVQNAALRMPRLATPSDRGPILMHSPAALELSAKRWPQQPFGTMKHTLPTVDRVDAFMQSSLSSSSSSSSLPQLQPWEMELRRAFPRVANSRPGRDKALLAAQRSAERYAQRLAEREDLP